LRRNAWCAASRRVRSSWKEDSTGAGKVSTAAAGPFQQFRIQNKQKKGMPLGGHEAVGAEPFGMRACPKTHARQSYCVFTPHNFALKASPYTQKACVFGLCSAGQILAILPAPNFGTGSCVKNGHAKACVSQGHDPPSKRVRASERVPPATVARCRAR
jgi:hypothetical protein